MPEKGFGNESFIIENAYFEYSDQLFTNGYMAVAPRGGVITHNGQKLKIKYYYNTKTKKNVILYIAELE